MNTYKHLYIFLVSGLLLNWNTLVSAQSQFKSQIKPASILGYSIPIVYPHPQKLIFSDSLFCFEKPTEKSGLDIFAPAQLQSSLKFVVNESSQGNTDLVFRYHLLSDSTVKINSPKVLFKVTNKPSDEQSYQISVKITENTVLIDISGDETGCIYGAITLVRLIKKINGNWYLPIVRIQDSPTFKQRIFCGSPNSENVEQMLSWMLFQKMDCLALASRNMTNWWEADSNFTELLDRIHHWKTNIPAFHIMTMHNIYEGKKIEISNPSHRLLLKKKLEHELIHGIDRIMICADDLAPFDVTKGYFLESENDQKMFSSMAEAHCFLMKDIADWLVASGYNCELYFCPAFYTFEDMHYGLLSLYKNTPWGEEIFRILEQHLGYIGQNMPENVKIIWTGPNVRSRKISQTDIDEWKSLLNGRLPFLWDNTLYSHHPFTATPLFTAYSNDFPDEFNYQTDSKGMYLNGDITNELYKIPCMTANDYLWNPADFSPKKSLEKALSLTYGDKAVEPILNFKKAELSLRRLNGEKSLKPAIDSLWARIVDVKKITQKKSRLLSLHLFNSQNSTFSANSVLGRFNPTHNIERIIHSLYSPKK